MGCKKTRAPDASTAAMIPFHTPFGCLLRQGFCSPLFLPREVGCNISGDLGKCRRSVLLIVSVVCALGKPERRCGGPAPGFRLDGPKTPKTRAWPFLIISESWRRDRVARVRDGLCQYGRCRNSTPPASLTCMRWVQLTQSTGRCRSGTKGTSMTGFPS